MSKIKNKVKIRYLGIQNYVDIYQQMQLFTEQRTASTEDEIWLLQHPPIFTLGRNSKAEHLLDTGAIVIQQIDRGGQVTYHGPGQLIAYLLLDLKRLGIGVRALVTLIEQSIIDTLSVHDISAYAKKEAPGVYTTKGKIAALGLRIRKGHSYHGLSLNVKMNLRPFSQINPCGYKNLDICQVADYKNSITIKECEQSLLTSLLNVINLNK